MAAADLLSDLTELDKTLTSIETVLDPDAKKEQIADLQQQASAPDLWNDQDNAQRVTSKLSSLQAEVDRLAALRQRVDDLSVLIELGQEEADEATLTENVRAFVDAVTRAKPAGAKGAYVKKVSLSSTMGPGVSLDLASASGSN